MVDFQVIKQKWNQLYTGPLNFGVAEFNCQTGIGLKSINDVVSMQLTS